MLQPFCETNIIFVNLYFILYMHLYIIFKVYSNTFWSINILFFFCINIYLCVIKFDLVVYC